MICSLIIFLGSSPMLFECHVPSCSIQAGATQVTLHLETQCVHMFCCVLLGERNCGSRCVLRPACVFDNMVLAIDTFTCVWRCLDSSFCGVLLVFMTTWFWLLILLPTFGGVWILVFVASCLCF